MDSSDEVPRFLGFGVFEADRKARELRKQGRRVRLQDQPFRVLCTLLDRAGSVVTRDELRRELWPGSTYVDFDHGLNNAVARLRDALGDSATSPQYIETLPRVGYRFIFPVKEPAVAGPCAAPAPGPPAPTPDPSATSPAAESNDARHASRPRAAVLVAIAGALVALLVGGWLSQRFHTATVRPPGAAGEASVAVLPFVSLSREPEDEFFAAGLSDELLHRLSFIRDLKVAGRASSFHFKERSQPPEAIARALGVRYLLEGSVRRSGGRVRITSQLVDARSGFHVWSETFERDFDDIFAIEDQIALAVAAALEVRVVGADAQQLRRRGTANAEAYRLYLMAMAKLRALGVKPDRAGALQLLQQAIDLDPGFAAAHAGIASYHFQNTAASGLAPEEGATLGRAAAERAFALAPGSSEALRVMADFEMWRYRFLGESAAYRRADALFRQAIEVDPANSYAYFDYGRAIQWCEPRRALALFERSAELDPRFLVASGLASLAMSRLGMHEAARLRVQDQVARAGEAYAAPVVASLEGNLGHLDRAVAALQGPALNPSTARPLQLWGMHRSLGHDATARDALRDLERNPLTAALGQAALLGGEGRYGEAFALLDRARANFPVSRVLDLPAARFALLAGEPERARALLEERLPDLASGYEEVTAPRVLPALDLVLAWSLTGRTGDSRRLLERVEAFLDGPDRPQLPMFTVQRARAHALAGEPDLAQQSLDRGFEEGFRMTCVIDLAPQPLLYVDCIDADPAFAALRRDGRFDRWLARIRADNVGQLDRLQARAARGAT